MNEPFAPRRRPLLTHGVALLLAFAATAGAIRFRVERQAAILDTMEIQPVASAAELAYGWGNADDAKHLLTELIALAERPPSADAPRRSPGEPDFVMLRRMDADMAKLRLAVLENAPRARLDAICAAATIRCTPVLLDRLVAMVKKQRHVP